MQKYKKRKIILRDKNIFYKFAHNLLNNLNLLN